MHLHVTLLSTPNPRPRTRFFGLKPNAKIPSMVLTTFEGARQREDGSEPVFNSMSYHGQVRNLDGTPANSSRDGAEEWVVKIFSKQRVEDSWLRKAFGKIGWVHRKEVCCLASFMKFGADATPFSGMRIPSSRLPPRSLLSSLPKASTM